MFIHVIQIFIKIEEKRGKNEITMNRKKKKHKTTKELIITIKMKTLEEKEWKKNLKCIFLSEIFVQLKYFFLVKIKFL